VPPDDGCGVGTTGVGCTGGGEKPVGGHGPFIPVVMQGEVEAVGIDGADAPGFGVGLVLAGIGRPVPVTWFHKLKPL
jgi:hypothetical protein